MTPRRYRSCLLLVVASELVLTWIHPSADAPRHYSRDLSLSVDGYWYLAEARAWARNEEPRVNRGYRKPLISFPAYLAYRVAGVSIASSRVLNSAASLATLLLLAELIRRRYGEASALTGAFLFAIDPAWHAYVRSPVIYPWVSCWILASIAIAAGTGARRWWSGLAVLAAGAFFLKSVVLLAAPAILLEGLFRIRGRGGWRKLRRLPLAGAVVVTLAIAVGFSLWLAPSVTPSWWRRVAFYMSGDAPWWSRPWTLDERSLFFSAFPLVFLLSALAAPVFIVFAFPARDRGRNLERMFHLVLWIGLATFAFARYSPLRYLLGLFPILVYLSIAAIDALCQLAWRRSLAPRALRRGLACLCGVLLAVFAFRQYWLALASSPLPAAGLAITGSALALVGTTAIAAVRTAMAASASSGSTSPLRWRPSRGTLLWVAAVALVVSAPRWSEILADPQYTLERAGRQISCVLPPNARIVGPYAHALAVENSLEAEQVSQLRYGRRALRDMVARRGWTHIVMDRPENPGVLAAFERDGVSLQRIDTFQVRGTLVDLYRVRASFLPLSRFEEAMDLLRRGEAEDAEKVFLEIVQGSPRCAAAWEGLGRCRLGRGDAAAARSCFLEALRHDPERVGVHLALLDLYAANGYRREALQHLQALRSMELRSAGLARHLDEVESRLAAPQQTEPGSGEALREGTRDE